MKNLLAITLLLSTALGCQSQNLNGTITIPGVVTNASVSVALGNPKRVSELTPTASALGNYLMDWAVPGVTNYSQTYAALQAQIANFVINTNGASRLPPINVVRDFGAVNDGVTPTQDQIQRAVDYALSNKISDIYFPSGTYLLLTNAFVNTPFSYAKAVHAVDISMPSGGRLRLYGESDSTILFTNDPPVPPPGTNILAAPFYLEGPGDTVQFDHLTFVSKHTLNPVSQIVGILQGFSFDALLTNFVVNNCYFRDWCPSVYANYALNCTFNNNVFRYTKGRDESEYDGTPATGIRTLGTKNVTMIGNDWSGSDLTDYSSVLPGPSGGKGPMDNFFHGYAQNAIVMGNFIRKNGFEGMFFNNRNWETNDPYLGFMSGNYLGNKIIEGNIIDGDIQSNMNYVPYSGITVQDNGATVVGNQIHNCETGLYMQWDTSGANAHTNLQSLYLVNNNIKMINWGQFESILPNFQQGVLVIGYTNVTVKGNKILIPSRGENHANLNQVPGIDLEGVYSADVSDNWIQSDIPVTSNPRYPTNAWSLIGLRVNGGANLHIGRNFINNVECGMAMGSISGPCYLEQQAMQGVLTNWIVLGTTNTAWNGNIYTERETTTFYAPTNGWYRMIVAGQSILGGRLTLMALCTNESSILQDSMVYQVNANINGAGNSIQRICASPLTTINPVLKGARLSVVDTVSFIPQLDFYINTNAIVTAAWESFFPMACHINSQPYVANDNPTNYVVTDTNLWPYSPGFTGTYSALTANHMGLEMTLATALYETTPAFSSGVEFYTYTNQYGSLVVKARTAAAPQVIWDSTLGGSIQTNYFTMPVLFNQTPTNAAIGNDVYFVNSNKVIYGVSSTKTNLWLDLR